MGEENRKFKRFAVDVMKISGKMMFASTVDIIDISLGGISLHVDRALKMGSEYMLRIETKDRSISVKGAVVWSTLSGSRKTAEGDIVPLYSVGMRFDDLASEKINDLVEFIESHKEEQDSVKLHSLNNLRVNMRFHLAANGDFILTCPEDFSVKKISLGGMLIETEHALELEQQLPMEVSLQGDSEISFTGRIASCIPIGTVELKQFAIGIEFLHMPEETIEKLTGFIKMFL
jgi:Tfp pilus assembly protein PilZ